MKTPRSARNHAAGTVITALTVVVLVGGCKVAQRPDNRKDAGAQEQSTTRLALDPVASPVPFRWLADDAVLVDTQAGARKLAGFGNYVSRVSLKITEVRLSVWDDEAAWKLAAQGREEQDSVLSHKRAEYVKDLSPPDPVDRYLVFGGEGMVEYQRDFRSYPLTETDTLD